ncbi:tRNA proofreading protein [Clostridiaceae bacterium JG1575]|nr:tRNA proofreading protein [Clostridiaceae bacterium JG1575]
MSFEVVEAFLKERGLGARIHRLEASSATVPLAAKAIGCREEQIAKTLTFLLNEEPLIVVCAGNVKIQNAKFKATFGAKAKLIPAPLVQRLVGHEVGGVCPFAVLPGVPIYFDVSLEGKDLIYPAAGDDHSMVALSLEELTAYVAPRGFIDVCTPMAPS